MWEKYKKSLKRLGVGGRKACLLLRKPLLILYFGKMLDTCSKFSGDAQQSNVLSSILFCVIDNLPGTNIFLFVPSRGLGAVSRPWWLWLGSVFSLCLSWKTWGWAGARTAVPRLPSLRGFATLKGKCFCPGNSRSCLIQRVKAKCKQLFIYRIQNSKIPGGEMRENLHLLVLLQRLDWKGVCMVCWSLSWGGDGG